MTGLCQGTVAAKRSQVVDLSQPESFFGSLPGLLDMKKDYDFQDACRGAVIPGTDKNTHHINDRYRNSTPRQSKPISPVSDARHS